MATLVGVGRLDKAKVPDRSGRKQRVSKEIAAQSGFEDEHYFSRLFKTRQFKTAEMARQLAPKELAELKNDECAMAAAV